MSQLLNKRFVVVEQAGMLNERDIATHDRPQDAWADLEKRYSRDEKDTTNPKTCLWPDVRFDWTDENGEAHSEYGAC
jgi:hypothetical protein